MNTVKPVVAANSSRTESGVVVTLQSTSILLAILVSGSVLVGLVIKLVTNLNEISSSMRQIKEELKEVSQDAVKLNQLEKRIDLHIQDYTNSKDVTQMLLGQLNEKITHKFKRLLFYNRQMQRFLQKDTSFQIREYEESKEDEES